MRSSLLAVLFVVATWAGPTKVVMGDQHGLWLKSDGSLWAWGGNQFGQLGVQSELADEPVRVPGLNGVRDIAAGDYFSVAVLGDGSLKIWGEPDGLGDAGMLRGVKAVAAAGKHILALREDGSVWEWGKGARGLMNSSPRRVDGIDGVVAIAASANHSAAAKSDGSLWLWEDHGAGDLGNGDYGYAAAPAPVKGITDVVAVAAGYQFTVALKRDGTVWAIGYGAAGQLGNGSEENSTRPVQVRGVSTATAIAAGYMHAMALRSDGTVWSWGYNHERQLGQTQVQAEQSTSAVRSGTLGGAIAIAAARSHSAAVAAREVWVWGQNEGGVLGWTEEELRRSDVPMRVGEKVSGPCTALFSCSTAGGKVIQICGVQDEGRVDVWREIEYRYGPENGPAELLYAGPMSFSEEQSKRDGYVVSVRFANGGYRYRVYSAERSRAGVEVEDSTGKRVGAVDCNERPEIFAEYLKKNLSHR
jgi:alpha-tubulin suppressor-like RCC1 family protein